jgi:hypothetical protein
MKTIIETKTVEHPLEAIFGIERGTTEITVEQVQTDMVVIDSYDEKDREIEGQFQEVYDAAMTSFADQAGLLTQSDPKYSARNMEVANAFLNTALSAAKEKAALKIAKEKNSKESGPKTVNNNLIMDRNELLKMLKDSTVK